MNKKSLLNISLITTAFIVIILFPLFIDMPQLTFENIALHSSFAGIFSLIALAMSWLFYNKFKEELSNKYFFLSMGFLSIGILRLFISISIPGEGLRILHFTASLLGSTLFGMVWFSNLIKYRNNIKWVPYIVGIIAFIIGTLELTTRATFPKMIESGIITPANAIMNHISGILFLIAGLYFAIEYYRNKKTPYLLIVFVMCLFCLSSLFCYRNPLWSIQWWGWHFVLLLGHIILLSYFILNFKLTRESLKKSEERFKTAIKHSEIIYANTGLDMRYNWIINPHPDFDPKTVIGKRDIDISDDKGTRQLTKLKQKTIDTGKKQQKDISFQVSSGVTTYDILAVPLMSDAGQIVGVATSSLDITERKQLEEELKEHRNHLEELVQERTVQLEDVNKELESFSHSVSHDLRAPLRAIDGFTRILVDDYASKLDKEGQRLGTVIQDNTKKMSKLIDDLLEFSRTGRVSLSYSSIDIKNMVNAIYHEVKSEEDRKRIKFTVADLPNVESDTNLMRQVWINLISNAVKFTSKRKQAVISVGCIKEKDKFIYKIKDNGAGFKMEYVDKIFGVFQRLHSDKEFEGTGIGLSLVQRIILRHNGKVWAESEVDKGAEFFFSLPNKKRWVLR